MELRTRRLVLTLGGSVILSLGVLAACSSDSSFSQLPGSTTNTGTDSGKKPTTDSGDGDDNGESTDGGANGADCSAAPTPRDSSGVYCHRGTDGGSLYCDPSATTCCDGAKTGSTFEPSTCANHGTACTFKAGSAGGLPYECLQKKHCGDTQACCLTAGSKGSPKAATDTKNFPGCDSHFFTDSTGNFTAGTVCETSCAAGELELCNTDDDCSGGKSCKYLAVNSHDTGYCQ